MHTHFLHPNLICSVGCICYSNMYYSHILLRRILCVKFTLWISNCTLMSLWLKSKHAHMMLKHDKMQSTLWWWDGETDAELQCHLVFLSIKSVHKTIKSYIEHELNLKKYIIWFFKWRKSVLIWVRIKC